MDALPTQIAISRDPAALDPTIRAGSPPLCGRGAIVGWNFLVSEDCDTVRGPMTRSGP